MPLWLCLRPPQLQEHEPLRSGATCYTELRPWPSKGSKLFLLTFGLSLLWIGGFAFLMVWWTDTAARTESSVQMTPVVAQVAKVVGAETSGSLPSQKFHHCTPKIRRLAGSCEGSLPTMPSLQLPSCLLPFVHRNGLPPATARGSLDVPQRIATACRVFPSLLTLATSCGQT